MTIRRGRLPWWTPEELDDTQREVYEAIVGGHRTLDRQHFRVIDAQGRLEGPFNAMLFAPAVGLALQHLGAAVRYFTSLSDRIRETAILQVARHHRSDFEWYAHERVGIASGLNRSEITDLAEGRAASTFDDVERAAFEVVETLLTDHDVDDGMFAEASVFLDEQALVELVTLIGYYELLALSLKVWRVPLPDGVEGVFD